MVLTAAVLGPKLAAFFIAVARLHGGWVGRQIVGAAADLVEAEIQAIVGWAGNLVTAGKLAEGMPILNTWLKAHIDPYLPALCRRLFDVDGRIDRLCQWIVANEDRVFAEMAKAEAEARDAVALAAARATSAKL